MSNLTTVVVAAERLGTPVKYEQSRWMQGEPGCYYYRISLVDQVLGYLTADEYTKLRTAVNAVLNETCRRCGVRFEHDDETATENVIEYDYIDGPNRHVNRKLHVGCMPLGWHIKNELDPDGGND